MSTADAPSDEILDVGGEIPDAPLLLSIHLPHKESEAEASFDRNPGPTVSVENETIYARGAVLSVTQAAFLVICLALLFVAVAGNIFAGVLVVGVILAIFGCLHYWVWGRWMSSALPHPGRKEQH